MKKHLVFVFNYHVDIPKRETRLFTKRRDLLNRIHTDGYETKQYHDGLVRRRIWVEFDTAEEALMFKLRYL